ncbi:Pectinesterase inhibitor domain [Macleaya cordata]|uniref:Pectinesterase inhibitor domain n=1 Tax=Macleaya cordata TaxID=56857 RepID=A0A200PW74_MACCD|nr:Pectinesterase inhibitor domain [Macleaya cordata]
MNPSFSLISCFLFLLLLLLLFNAGGVNGTDITNETCTKAADSDPNLNYNFCLSSLQSNPKSLTSDLQGLGVISMELCLSNGTNINSHIGKLLEGQIIEVNPSAIKYLKDCLELYTDAIYDTQDAIKAFEANDYSSANIKMSSVMDASTNCEDGFKEEGHNLVSPLEKENSDFFQLTAISLAITNLVNHPFDFILSM